MDNVFTICQEVLSEFLVTLGNLWTDFFDGTVNEALRNVADIPIISDVLEFINNFLGFGEMSVLSLIIGGGLFGILVYNIVKFIVGLISGS